MAALLTSVPPVYSSKNLASGTCQKCVRDILRHRSETRERDGWSGLVCANLGKFRLEYVNFVKEEDDGCSNKPPRVYDRFE